MSLSESKEYMRNIMKPKGFKRNDFLSGSILHFQYDAKDKTQTYDKTPLVLVLGTNRGYLLGLNLHWLPFNKREWLVDKILEHSKTQIKKKNRVVFSYEDFRPLMESVDFQPCVRVYIRKRISVRGVVIPPHEFKNAVRLKTESFTQGKYTQSELYQIAKKRGNKK